MLQACKTGGLELLQRVSETVPAKSDKLLRGFWTAIDHDQANVVKYLLERGVDKVDDHTVMLALKASAIQVLEVLKDFGWNNVNMTMREISPRKSGEAFTALL
jgi:hypothetical protein